MDKKAICMTALFLDKKSVSKWLLARDRKGSKSQSIQQTQQLQFILIVLLISYCFILFFTSVFSLSMLAVHCPT